MRTIKFRGIDTMSGEMVYGDLAQQKLTDGSTTTAIVQTYATYDVNSKTIGQFTGLLDKNGKEIYEGDIIEIKDEGVVFTKVVGFNNGMFGAGNYTLAFYGEDNIEIIGNIHDNPELLKGE